MVCPFFRCGVCISDQVRCPDWCGVAHAARVCRKDLLVEEVDAPAEVVAERAVVVRAPVDAVAYDGGVALVSEDGAALEG